MVRPLRIEFSGALYTDPKGVTTHYRYNGFNERLEENSPDAGTTAYRYDQGGNLSEKTDARGITTQYHYDAANRLTRVRYLEA